MRRDGGGRRRERPAHRGQRRGQPGRAALGDRRHRARGRGARPPALDDPGARAGARAGRPRATGRSSKPSPSPKGPGLAGSLLVGITMAKTLAWVERPAARARSTTSRATSTPRGCSTPTRPDRPAPEFPLVALVVSGGHTFLVEMADHLPYRLLGQTVDDAAGEAFDKVGRLLGLPYPGGPAIMKAAAGAVQRDRRFPRAWLGDTFDFSFSGLKTAARREVARELGADANVESDRTATAAAGCGGRRARLRLPGLGRRRAGDQDAARGRGDRRADDRRGRRRGRQLRAARADRGGRGDARRARWSCRGPGLCTDNAAMIGAAGFFRARAGARAGDGPRGASPRSSWPCLRPRLTATGRTLLDPQPPVGRARRALPAAPRPRRAQATQPEPPGRRRRCSRPSSSWRRRSPGRHVLEIGPGPGHPDRGAARARAPTSPPSRSTSGCTRTCDARFEALVAGQLASSRRTCSTRRSGSWSSAPYDVVANLPYHITSPVLHHVLGDEPRPERFVLMVQREVAERIASPPGGMSYLSVFVQYHADVRVAFARAAHRRSSRRRRSSRPCSSGEVRASAAAAGRGGALWRARPGRLPRAAQDAPQRAAAPAAAGRAASGSRRRWPRWASRRTGGRRRSAWRSGWRSPRGRADRGHGRVTFAGAADAPRST